jgi:hypothetical protein
MQKKELIEKKCTNNSRGTSIDKAGLTNLHNPENIQIRKYDIITIGTFPHVLAQTPHKPCTTNFVALTPV